MRSRSKDTCPICGRARHGGLCDRPAAHWAPVVLPEDEGRSRWRSAALTTALALALLALLMAITVSLPRRMPAAPVDPLPPLEDVR
jgi:hypothetical protein